MENFVPGNLLHFSSYHPNYHKVSLFPHSKQKVCKGKRPLSVLKEDTELPSQSQTLEPSVFRRQNAATLSAQTAKCKLDADGELEVS